MKLNVRKDGEINIVECSGAMRTGFGAEELGEAVRSLIDAGERRVLLNVQGVPWMDSGSIGEVTAAGKYVLDNGGKIGVVLNKKGLDLFTTFRLHDAFDIFSDVDSAIDTLK